MVFILFILAAILWCGYGGMTVQLAERIPEEANEHGFTFDSERERRVVCYLWGPIPFIQSIIRKD